MSAGVIAGDTAGPHGLRSTNDTENTQGALGIHILVCVDSTLTTGSGADHAELTSVINQEELMTALSACVMYRTQQHTLSEPGHMP